MILAKIFVKGKLPSQHLEDDVKVGHNQSLFILDTQIPMSKDRRFDSSNSGKFFAPFLFFPPSVESALTICRQVTIKDIHGFGVANYVIHSISFGPA